jgi:hypothetical protein
MLLAKHVASRKLNVDGAVTIEALPHAPVVADTSAVVLTFNVVAAAAGPAHTPRITSTSATTPLITDFLEVLSMTILGRRGD